jgi:hypothetical protein
MDGGVHVDVLCVLDALLVGLVHVLLTKIVALLLGLAAPAAGRAVGGAKGIWDHAYKI